MSGINNEWESFMKWFEHKTSVARRVRVGRGLLIAVSVAVAACGGEPTAPPPPTTGSIAATVSGLPSGYPAVVNVSGPNGYDRTLTASATLPELVPGTYDIGAANVQDGVHQYQASPAIQTIIVVASATPANVTVDYGLTTGGLDLTVVGVPAGSAGNVQITGPGFTQAVTASQTFTSATPGSYTVTALSVIIGSNTYVPSPASQVVDVPPSRTPAAATVTYADAGAAPLNLTIDHAYVVQATQRYAKSGSDVPLIEDRDALLRVFATASVTNSVAPDVRVRLYRSGALVDTQVLAALGASVPTSASEGSLSASWNFVIPAALIRSDLSYLVDVDPSNAIVEDDETDNTFPADGTPLGVTVVAVPPMAVRLIPVRHDTTGRTGDVSAANLAEYVGDMAKVFPTSGVDAEIGAMYTTSAPPLQSDDGNGAWGQILNEIRMLRLADGSSRYYYGVVSPDYSSGVAGLGYVPGSPASTSKASIGWDRGNSKGWVMAHEVGHNHGRRHSPGCGAGGPDAGYPYAGGSIGVYGLDLGAMVVKSPTTHFDFMAYCSTRWVSDYVFEDVLQWRVSEAGSPIVATVGTTQVMVVWGRITSRGMILEPAFVINGSPALPQRPGPYRVSALADDGSSLFDVSFDGEEVADLPGPPQRHFAFTIPVSGRTVDRVRTLRLRGPSGQVERGSPAVPRGAAVRAPGYRVDRSGAARVRLQWDGATYPMVMVRDRATGSIVALVRNGGADVVAGGDDLELVFSDGVRSAERMVRVP
jgi:hypothetical protein